MKNKTGQIAVWFIIGAIFVGTIILLFVFDLTPDIGIRERKPFLLQPFLESCTRESVQNSLDLMLPQGGFLQPTNFVAFENKKVSFICYYNGYFDPCIGQHPLFLNELKEELKKQTTSDLIECFDRMQNEAERKSSKINFDNADPPQVKIDLEEDLVIIGIVKPLTLIKDSSRERFEDFEVFIQSPLYNLGKIAAEISDQEARYCHFETVGYTLLNPRYNIVRYSHLSDGAEVYSINDTTSGEEMLIAVRSCALPLGLP